MPLYTEMKYLQEGIVREDANSRQVYTRSATACHRYCVQDPPRLGISTDSLPSMERTPVTVSEPSEKDWLILIDSGAIGHEASQVRVGCGC